jgi:N-acetylmuramoyl-L-alanine amidase
MYTMNVGLVIGHTTNGLDKGAFSKFLGLSESEYWVRVLAMMPSFHQGMTITCYAHSNNKSYDYYKRQLETSSIMNRQNFDLVAELHFNSATPSANGVETLYYFSSKKGKIAAEIFSYAVHENYESKLRGVNGAKALVNKDDRGARFVMMQKAPAIVFEPFFGSNEDECKEFADYSKMKNTILTALSRVKSAFKEDGKV